jgi:hypothetical protein
VYKYDGSNVPTLLASSGDIYIYDPATTAQYIASVVFPQTTLLTTDRIYIELRAKATKNNKDVTIYFGGTTPTHVHTTFPSVGGSGLLKVINGVYQTPASLLVNTDVAANAAIDQSKINGLTEVASKANSTYTTVQSNSAAWGNGSSDVSTLSGKWESASSLVQAQSANWGSTASGTLTYELSVIDTTQGLYKNGDLIPVGTSIENILINMLKTSVPPTYTSPTLSVAYGSPTVVATYEVGDTISSFTITPTFNANDSGGSTGFVYFKDASNLGTGSSKVVSSFQINSSTTLQVSAGYSQGAIKNDNLGNPYPTGRINSGSITSTATLNVLYPYFWGKSNTLPTAASIASDIQNGSANKVLASASGTVSVTYNASGEYIWFAHTAAQTEKTKWYVTALNNGSIGSGQAINSPITQNVTSPDAYWSGVSFKIYISSGQQATTGTFEYRNS